MMRCIMLNKCDATGARRKIQINQYQRLCNNPQADINIDIRIIKVTFPENFEIVYQLVKMLEATENQNILNVTRLSQHEYYSNFAEFSLHSIIYDKKYLYPKRPFLVADMFFQIIQGVHWLHDKKIFHAYINPKDIYLENYYRIKIGGFYFSEILPTKESVSKRNERSTYYTPTRDEQQRLGFKYDLWCIGLVIYEMIFLKQPQQELYANLQNEQNWNNSLPTSPIQLYNHYKTFLRFNPAERPLLNDVEIKDIVEQIRSEIKEHFQKVKNSFTVKPIGDSTFKATYNGVEYCFKLRSMNKETHDFQRELCIYTDPAIEHERFAVPFGDHFATHGDPHISILMKFTKHRSLKDEIGKLQIHSKKFETVKLNSMVKELIKILAIMHEKNIIHRNIKPSNVLIFEENGELVLKFSDFYAAKTNVSDANVRDDDDDDNLQQNNEENEGALNVNVNYTIIKSSHYTAPELFDNNHRYGKPCDVWSVGCVIYEMYFLEKPYQILKKPIEPPLGLNETENTILKLCKRMLVIDPSKRSSATELWKSIEC